MFIHIGAGLLCLTIGPVAMLARPKGSPCHRKAGRWFMGLMLVLAVTAGLLLCVRWNPFFFALSVFAFYLAFSGWRVLRRKQPHRSAAERAHLIDWAAAFGTVIVGFGSLYLWRVGVFGSDAAIVLGTLGFAVVAALYDLWRFAQPNRLARYTSVWLLEHLTKLSGAYIAVACAFTGTVFTQFNLLPVAIAQTWPAIIGTPLLLFVANRYWQRGRRARHNESPAAVLK